MAEAALETVLRRDRIVVGTALAGLAALAWGYVLWLAADMNMGGMDKRLRVLRSPRPAGSPAVIS